MPAVVVAGFTTAAIHAAAAAAGPGGHVEFPPGSYDATGLEVLEPDQTWFGASPQRTIILRGAAATGNVVEVKASGFRCRDLSINGNRAVNLSIGSGIGAQGFDLDLENVLIAQTSYYGITQTNAALLMDKCRIIDTAQLNVFWRITDSKARRGPQLYRSVFDKVRRSEYVGGGNVAILGSVTGRVQETRVRDCWFGCYIPPVIPGKKNDSGGLAVFCGDYTIVGGSIVSQGRIGISFLDCDFTEMTENHLRGCASYHYEIVRCAFTTIANGTIRGPGLHSIGVEENDSTDTTLTNMKMSGVGKRIQISRTTKNLVRMNA